MAFELSDLTGLGKPVLKLIEVVSEGIGTVYRPRQIREDAKARADGQQIAAIKKAENDLKVREMQFDAALQHVDKVLAGRPALAELARRRVLAREIEGFLNLETIADLAADQLPPQVLERAVDADWRRKFFLEAENVCDADMQLLWAKVLAGEVATPGRYSIRTLDTLRQLSRSEAETFKRACALAMKDGWIALPSNDLNVALEPFGLPFDSILALRDAGLLLPSDTLVKVFKAAVPLSSIAGAALPQNSTPPTRILFALENNGVHIQMTSPLERVQVPALIFTKAGAELQRLMDNAENPQYLTSIGQAFRRQKLTARRGTATQMTENLTMITYEQDL